jgi:hypothetical protein
MHTQGIVIQKLAGARDVSSPNRPEGCGFHPASSSVGTGGFCSGVKRLGRQNDSLPSNVEVENECSSISTSPYVVIAYTGINLPLLYFKTRLQFAFDAL